MYRYMPIVQTGRSRGFISTKSPEPGYLAVRLFLDPFRSAGCLRVVPPPLAILWHLPSHIDDNKCMEIDVDKIIMPYAVTTNIWDDDYFCKVIRTYFAKSDDFKLTLKKYVS